MADGTLSSPLTPQQITERILSLCPGGPVGAVQAAEGRLLLPRRVSSEQVVIERRRPGLPPGRIVVQVSPSANGCTFRLRAAIPPAVALFSAALIATVSLLVARFAGSVAGAVTATLLVVLEAVRWRYGRAGVAADAAWLTEQLQRV
jgi:hypothetical protein